MKKITLFYYALFSICLVSAQNLLIVKSGDFYGILNNDGVIVLPPTYHSIENFGAIKSGWAKVELDGKYGFINTDGEIVVDVKYDELGYFGDYHKNLLKIKKDGGFGFIDKSGSIVTQTVYDSIGMYGNYHKNWALVKLNQLNGFIDTSGKEVCTALICARWSSSSYCLVAGLSHTRNHPESG